jgi:protein-disulfide isomerase
MMKKGTGLVLIGATVVGGFLAGRALRDGGLDSDDAVEPVPVAGGERKRIPLTGEAQGPANAPGPPQQPQVSNEVYKVMVGEAATKGGSAPKVTIVAFSEFQCPYCALVAPTVSQILETYKDDVQVAFKHLPLDMHKNAQDAALAAEAARQQGKFWEMHDKMFANQRALSPANVETYAQELGLDLPRFKAALGDPKLKERIEADKKQAAQFGARGTPTFFVNGRKMIGAQPFAAFKTVIDEEIAKADEKLKAGTARQELYAAFLKTGLEKAAPPPPPPPRPGAPDSNVIYRAEIKGAPSKGAKDALVTIVEFSDFQCPYCTRVEPTISQVLEEYKGKVRVVWRDFPLPSHKDAVPAAALARVAAEQGKFWQMHAKLFEKQRALDRVSLEKYGQELGLPAAKVEAALDEKKYETQIKADQAMGQKIGVGGTPAFFINGTFLSGAQPFEEFKRRIDRELVKAEALVEKGVPRSKVYDTIMKDAQAAVAAAAAPPSGGAAAEPSPETDQTVFKVDAGRSPSRGPKNAPVTVILFSDFECPYCSRVEPSITQLEKDFPGKIRVVWKDFPLGMHRNARPAAIAARAAGDEGKFWQMHAKLFANQRSLDRASLEKYAQELGLDLTKFRAALDTGKFSSEIDADMRVGQTLGIQGTPAAFINGRKIHGAYPYDTFKTVVEQALAKARKRS